MFCYLFGTTISIGVVVCLHVPEDLICGGKNVLKMMTDALSCSTGLMTKHGCAAYQEDDTKTTSKQSEENKRRKVQLMQVPAVRECF